MCWAKKRWKESRRARCSSGQDSYLCWRRSRRSRTPRRRGGGQRCERGGGFPRTPPAEKTPQPLRNKYTHTHRDSNTLRYYTSHSVLLRRVLQALVHSGQSKQPHNDESGLSTSGFFFPPFDVNLLLSKRQKTIHGKFGFRKVAE